ncbi:Lys14p KNAG_0H01260 [Huiozyma naganishii CBS 8797]|uniref:Zn(2)-C6 fungal-type domain-containing protein n=1 Tax=Huiozyma naganishii (strain ATCC MYA-139 / BCRC 22969 / CBS 8797 / KCTC 17520 / NBRC 10181 / NCYC 3082 / Yp74L-3) TaxID=1071383 RepID=J7S8H5_HUIN7|nr:hypothetical protein KNAG_0H01260 [Kazachstania naganishii CBS 8797]CCK71539.1 hypothetical protein KNAG_0H01260 [Kazachstania naganishii CBS 8797]
MFPDGNGGHLYSSHLSGSPTDDREFGSVLSPPGNYLSPSSLDSRSSFVTGAYDSKNTATTPSSLSILNASSLEPLPSIYSNNNKIMDASNLINLKGEEAPRSGAPPTADNSPCNESNSESTHGSKNGHIVKRKYSRNGCVECKRRRMKCDETKPKCWQCDRLNRDCVYVLNQKNKKRKTTKRSKKNQPEDKETEIADINVDSHFNNNVELTHLSEPERSLSVPNLVPVEQMNGYDTNLLMQNLNDIVNMKLNESIMLNSDLKDFDLPDLDIPDLLVGGTSSANSVPISFLVNNIIQFNIKISAFKLGGVHDDYLKVFYNDCLDSIAPFFQDQGNPLRDILLSFARNESYLLSAILSIGASLAHRKSGKLEDEKNYCAYLSHCLNLLSEQFKNESNVVNKIEPIILTVILLAWDCIYTMNSRWRSHLKGVTDLFKKINEGKSSKVLNVAKCWFKVIETFASISTVLGGSLTDEDMDVIFDPYNYQYVDSLKFLNIMTPLNEFNLLRGHKEDFDLVIREVIRALNYIRSSERNEVSSKTGMLGKNMDYLLWTPQMGKGKEHISYFRIQKILVEIDRQLEYQFIDKSGIIPVGSSSHPEKSFIKDNAIDTVTLRNGEKIAISWYDISHQTQVLSFLLIVLLKLLGIPKESISVQQVVQKIMSFFKYLDSDDPPQNSRTCYSNFAVLMAGLNAMDEDTRNIVKRYYKVNGANFRRLTEHNLTRLEKVWYGTDDDYKLADQDVLTW